MKKADTITPANKKAMTFAVLSQSFGMLGQVAFSQGFMLIYFNALKLSAFEIMIFMSLPYFVLGFSLLPFAVLSARYQRKQFGIIGIFLTVIGFCFFAVTPLLSSRFFPLIAAIVFFSLGTSMFNAVWFELLHPHLPAHYRGRFLGILRFVWQSVGMLFYFAVSIILMHNSSLVILQIVLLLITAGLFSRFLFYRNITEANKPVPRFLNIGKAVKILVQSKGFVEYAAYIFLLTLFTSAVPFIFGLIEKKIMLLNDDTVSFLGVLLTAGNLSGYFLGGRIIDRFGTKTVFIACHFAYGAVMLLFPLRGFMPFPLVFIGILNFSYGLLFAASSTAITTEALFIAPQSHIAIATSANDTLINCGRSIAGFLCAWIVKCGMLSNSWKIGKTSASAYDTILISFVIMIILLVITLGLIPSVIIRKKTVSFRY